MANKSKTTIEERLDRIEKCIKENLQFSKWVLNFEEAAEYTGLSKSYLYKLTSGRQIPHSKPNGKQCYFAKNELDSWLLRNQVKTSAEITEDAATYVTLQKDNTRSRKNRQ